MSKINTLKDAILLCGRSNITPFVWGHAGMGKSSVIRQICAQHNMGFIDERCSQIEAPELRGLPDRVNGRTTYFPPATMPHGDLTPDQVLEELLKKFHGELGNGTAAEQHERLLSLVASNRQIKRRYQHELGLLQPRFETGILFLDELNRAQDDVLQAAFQLVLDRQIGQYSLPPGWMIVAAGNFMEGYQVNGFTDKAFLDRFCHLLFPGGESSVEDWIMHMTGVYGQEAGQVIEYVTQNLNNLDGTQEGELGFTVQPSRRSWDAVTRVLIEFRRSRYSEDAKLLALSGLVGMEQATAFSNYDCPVKPTDVINRGVKANLANLNQLKRNQLMGLMWGIISFVKDRMKEKQVRTVCADFAEWMCSHSSDRDLTVAFCRSLVSDGSGEDRAMAAVISNPMLAQIIAQHHKKIGADENFLDVLNSRPQLQKLLANVAWGKSADGSDD